MSGDVERDRVERTFRAAFMRVARAQTADEALDETSNLLHHVYRLAELTKQRLDRPSRRELDEVYGQTPGARGVLWVRCFDTHDVALVGIFDDVYTDTQTDMYGDVVWRRLAGVEGFPPDGDGRHQDYDEHLAGRGLLDTVRPVFDGLLRTLPEVGRAS